MGCFTNEQRVWLESHVPEWVESGRPQRKKFVDEYVQTYIQRWGLPEAAPTEKKLREKICSGLYNSCSYHSYRRKEAETAEDIQQQHAPSTSRSSQLPDHIGPHPAVYFGSLSTAHADRPAGVTDLPSVTSSLQESYAHPPRQPTRWRAGTFNNPLPVTPKLRKTVLWSDDTKVVDGPAQSLASLFDGSSAPSSPDSPARSLPSHNVWPSASYGSALGFSSYGDNPDTPSAALALPEPGDLPNEAAAGVFAIFRPVDQGKSLAIATSGTTIADMDKGWKPTARRGSPPNTTAPTPEEIRQKPLGCPYCGRRFTRPNFRREHIYSHTGERPFKCKVPGCNRTFSVPSNKYRHERTHKV